MKSILVIIDYFGAWPEWFPIFLETCKWNPTIDWLFHTDCGYDFAPIPNVKISHINRDQYIDRVRKTLGIKFAPADSYKFCDLRPMYGVLHYDDICGYDFFGYGDIDVVYGDIRKFYTDEVLENHVISAHNWCISGHFGLLRNVDWLRNAFYEIKGWKDLLEDGVTRRVDEDVFRELFRNPPNTFHEWRKVYCKEQFTTPLTPYPWVNMALHHPEVWYWKDGRVTNLNDGDREFIYLHFMNFKNARFIDPRYGRTPCWADRQKFMYISPAQIRDGVVIDRSGFHAMADRNELCPGVN